MTRTGREADPLYPTRGDEIVPDAATLRQNWQEYIPVRALELRGAIVALPEQEWERDPELLLALAATHRTASSVNLFVALSYLDAADQIIGDDARLRPMSMLQRATCLRGLGRLSEAHELALSVAESVGRAPLSLNTRLGLEARARVSAGITLALLGDLVAGESSILHGLGLGGFDVVRPWLIEGIGWLAIIASLAGTAASAHAHLARVHELGAGNGMLDDLAGVPTRIAESLVATDRGEQERALSTLAPLRSMTKGTEYEIARLHALALASSGPDGSFDQLDALQDARLLLQSWPSPGLHHMHQATLRALALLEVGSLGGARDAIAELQRELQLMPDPHHVCCIGRLEGRLALHIGEYELALEKTSGCRALGDDHAPRTLAYVDALRASARLQLGDTTSAARAIDRCLVVAARTGWRRPLLVLPTPILKRMLDSAATREQTDAVKAVMSELAATLPTAYHANVEPLSERERVILAHLASGRSRQEISALLHVSPNTVKSQTRSLYHKLSATSRHEAIERASEYGILT